MLFVEILIKNKLTLIMLNFCFRRTGKDITEGKVIRKDEEGYEIFEDYLSESGILNL